MVKLMCTLLELNNLRNNTFYLFISAGKTKFKNKKCNLISHLSTNKNSLYNESQANYKRRDDTAEQTLLKV